MFTAVSVGDALHSIRDFVKDALHSLRDKSGLGISPKCLVPRAGFLVIKNGMLFESCASQGPVGHL